jgi:uncharacterized RDD family membrane protein YckC
VGERAVAKLIDLMVLALPAALLIIPFLAVEDDEPTLDLPLWATLGLVGLFVAYDTVCVARWGATVGKRVFGLRVAGVGDGGRPDWAHSAIRVMLPASIAVIPVVGILFLGVYLRAFPDPMRQGFHDVAAGTVVVRTG